MIPKEPKENRWPFYTPGIFGARRWVKGKMVPQPFDKALKKKSKLSFGYLMVTLIGFNVLLYRRFIDRPDLADKEIETALSISHDQDAAGKFYTFEGTKLSKVEYFERKDFQPKDSTSS